MTLAVWWLAFTAPAFAAGFDDGFTSYLSGQYPRASSIWQPLAEAGDIEAQFGMGLLYEKGHGVLRNLSVAASWYARAAEQGSMRAQTQLGGMYARADGVAEDWEKAISWWRRAAAQGSKRAKYHLGQAYQYGSGVERDLDLALQWYGEAAILGFSAAARHIEEINRRRKAEAPTAEAPTETAAVETEQTTIIVPLNAQTVAHETVSALKQQSTSPLIALGASSTTPMDNDHRIYLASYSSIKKADEGWRQISSANPALLGNLDAAVAQVDLGRNDGIVYRLQAGPLPDMADANALCDELSQRDIPCTALSPSP